MAITTPREAVVGRPRASRLRRFSRKAFAILLLAVLASGLFWWKAPGLLAPVDEFAQGPGGAVAYVSLSNQIRDQSAQFWTGGDVQIRLDQDEFSGMLSSALLTGRGPGDPIQRVRGSLVDGEIKVETVLHLPFDSVPERLQGPLGLKLRLHPVVTETGLVQFRITRILAGRIPISPVLLRWADRVVPLSAPGFDAREATISLPLGEMVSRTLGRKLEIKQVNADDGQLHLTIAMPHD